MLVLTPSPLRGGLGRGFFGGGLELAPVDPMETTVEELHEDYERMRHDLYDLLHRFANCNSEPHVSAYVDMEPYLAGIQEWLNSHVPEQNRFFYHPDLPIAIGIGSSSFITDAAGEGYQHLQYMPFGETSVSQKISWWSTPYQFTGKEKDPETGFNYFGARYYNSDLSVWLSVDPIIKSFESPYVYCYNRPIRFNDPTGMDPDPSAKFERLTKKFEESNGGYVRGRILANFINRNSSAIGRHDARYSSKHRTVSYEHSVSRGGEFPNNGEFGDGNRRFDNETDVKWLCVAGIVRSKGGEDRKFKAAIVSLSSTNSALFQAYKYSDHTIRYAEMVNGQLRTANDLTNANKMHAAKMTKGLRNVGVGLTSLSIISAGTELYFSERSGEDWARMTGAVIITATAAIPLVGPIISLGLGIADNFGAFNSIYESFNK